MFQGDTPPIGLCYLDHLLPVELFVTNDFTPSWVGKLRRQTDRAPFSRPLHILLYNDFDTNVSFPHLAPSSHFLESDNTGGSDSQLPVPALLS